MKEKTPREVFELFNNTKDRGYNLSLAKKFDIVTSAYYINLVYLETVMTNGKGGIQEFYTTAQMVEEKTSLTRRQQDRAKRILEEHGYIRTRKGFGNIIWYTILKYPENIYQDKPLTF